MKYNQNEKKAILHIDVDSFFVSCEIALRPDLLGKEIAISTNNPNSIVTSLSYAAKNKGARVPGKLSLIKKQCENIIVIEPNMRLYQYFSKKIYDFLVKNYSKEIQIVSIDEWYIDVTNIWKKYKSIRGLANNIQNEMKNKLSLPVSIGVSYNKFLAKMATAINKPMGITFITHKNFKEIIWPMSIKNYYGIGVKSSSQLIKLGILTIGDLAKYDFNDKLIKTIFLNKSEKIINNANGYGDSKLNLKNNILSSVGNERVFKNGFSDDSKEIYNNLNIICKLVSKRLMQRNLCGSHISISLKLDKQKKSKSMTLNKLINLEEDIFLYSVKMMKTFWNNEPLIGIGVTISKLEDSFQNFVNHSLFEKDPKLSETALIVEKINSKMNEKVVVLGKEFKELKTSKQNKLL